jgi:hypothetical protein
MAVMMVLMSERVEKRLGAILTTFPPPIFVRTTSVSVFHVFLPPSIAIVQVGLYIGVLGQVDHLEKKWTAAEARAANEYGWHGLA